ncbi:MAG: alcohol dehydrogenase catalytic domain-containing protein [Parvularculaceae bacterium]
MRQLIFVRKGVLEWREAPDPGLESPTDARVRPFAVARCDLDNAFLSMDIAARLEWGRRLGRVDPRVKRDFGAKPFEGPFAYGHECVAEVVSVGTDVTSLAVGDVVIVPFQISCGRCLTCRRGLTPHCETVRTERPIAAYGFTDNIGGVWGGAMSDLVRVPFADHMLVPVPDGVDPVDLASASDNIPDGWRGVGPHLDRYPGAPVLVLGGRARSVGLYAAGIAVALGAERVD